MRRTFSAHLSFGAGYPRALPGAGMPPPLQGCTMEPYGINTTDTFTYSSGSG